MFKNLLQKYNTLIERFNHIFFGVFSNIVGNIIMFGTTIYLTRVIDINVYGEFRLIFSFVSLCVMVLLFGRDSGIIYFAQNSKAADSIEKDKLINDEIIISSLFIIVGVALLFLLKKIFIVYFFKNNISGINFQYALLMIIPWGIFNLVTAGLRAQKKINTVALLTNLTQRSIRVPFFIAFSIISASFISLALSMILSQVLLLVLAVRKLSFVFSFNNLNFRDFFSRFKYSSMLALNIILFESAARLDVMMLGRYSNTASIALYDTAIQLSFVIMFPYIALVKSSEPIMKDFFLDSSIRERYFNNLKLSIEFALGILLGFIFFGKFVLSFFGSNYTNGYGALIVLSSGYSLLVMLGTPFEFLNMTGNAKITSILLIITLLLNIVLCYFLIQRFNIIGAGFATLISLLLTRVIGMFIVLRKFKIRPFRKNQIRAVVPFIIPIILYIILFTLTISVSLIISIALLALYIILLLALNENYRIYLKNILHLS